MCEQSGKFVGWHVSPVDNGSDGVSWFVYFNESFDCWCRRVHVSVLPFRIMWDQDFAFVYAVPDLSLEVFGGVFGCVWNLLTFMKS